MSEPLRAPTADEKRQMAETTGELEKQMIAVIQAWGSAIYSMGFAAGVERALGPTESGLVVPIRPKLVIP